MIAIAAIGLGATQLGRRRARTTPAPKNALAVEALGARDGWTFTYEGGVTSPTKLVIPRGRPIAITLRTKDDPHALDLPALDLYGDATPGAASTTWFSADALGTFTGEPTETAGNGARVLPTIVEVLEPSAFARWLDDGATAALPPVARGAKLFVERGCDKCHAIEGTKKIGPSLRGVLGRREELEGGASVVIDEPYLRESLTAPQARTVKGYDASMPSFGALPAGEIDGLVAYMKTL